MVMNNKTQLSRTRVKYGSTGRLQVVLTAACLLFALYTLLPLFWVVVASTKTNQSLLYSFGLWFSGKFSFFSNVHELFTFQNGIFLHWLVNTLLYSVVSAVGATVICALGGFALAKYRFRGRIAIIAVVGIAVMVPTTALVLPMYLLVAKVHLVNNPAAFILPSLVSPFGLFLMTVYMSVAVPNELLEAATIDGAGTIRVLWSLVFPMISPVIVTVLLLNLVSSWNNYFLPLVVFSKSSAYPATVGLATWNQLATVGAGNEILYTLIACGGLVIMLPLVIAFLVLQRQWRKTIAIGGLTG